MSPLDQDAPGNRRKIRVLHVETGRHVYGGAQQVLYLIEHLPREGVECALVAPAGSEIARAATALGAPVFTGPVAGDLDLRLAAHVFRAARSWNPDIVHLQSRRGADTWGLLGARLAGRKVVLSRRVDNWEPALVGRIRFGSCDHVICVADGIREVLKKMGLPDSHMTVVHSAIDPGRFHNPATREELSATFGLSGDGPVMGIAAQLIERKGHRLVFGALQRLKTEFPGLQLLVFGRGPIEAGLKQEAAERGLQARVVFTGFRTDLPKWIGALDLLVQPSMTEGLANVLLQAAACGVPVIGTRVGGIPEATGHGTTGLLIPIGDESALAEAIRRLLTEPDLRRRFSEAGPGFIQSGFTPRHLAAGNAAVYRRVLER